MRIHIKRFIHKRLVLALAATLIGLAVWWILAHRFMNHTSRPVLPTPEEIAKLPPDGGPDFNRLIHETSPYLLQHAANPVDWHPWGAEALAKAKAEDKPIFLSVGYSSCHWCHVMEHESFEHDEVAEVLNRYFIPVKVDREERPDLDDIYMVATQVMTGRGGWPNSVWLTPDGRPWYAGTYFPREDRAGRPGFVTILKKLAELWITQRPAVEQQAHQLAQAIRQNGSIPATGSVAVVVSPSDSLQRALAEWQQAYDAENGGFGDAPKFPPHTALSLMIHRLASLDRDKVLPLVTGTLDAIRLGGIRDHVGGGFHRYSTDAHWLLPHFEKMLYDNAQLARAYTDAYIATGDEAYADTARDTFDWVLREMTDEKGGFFSAFDADSEGEEGLFYVWSKPQVLEALGPQAGEAFCRVYQIKDGGNYRDEATGANTGLNIPHLTRDSAPLAQGLAPARMKLRTIRAKRVWPALDDKVLVSWNGLMIGSLAHGGALLKEPRYVDAAARAARFSLTSMRDGDRLLHTYRAGKAQGNAFLDDYAALAAALLDLHEATGDARWRTEAETLLKSMIDRFVDPERGGFFFTSNDHEQLISRNRDVFDQAMPSASGLAVNALVRLGVATGNRAYLDEAERAVRSLSVALEKMPTGCAGLLHAALLLEDAQAMTLVAAPPPPVQEERPPVVRSQDDEATSDVVTVELLPKARAVRPGAEIDATLTLTIQDGWHVQAHVPSFDYLIGTKADVGGDFTLAGADFPKGRAVNIGGDELLVYTGTVSIPLRLRASDKARPPFVTAKVKVSWQACDNESCQAPQSVDREITLRLVE